MKTREVIEERLRAILVDELNRRVVEAKRKRPHLCQHNYRHPLDDRKMVEGEVILAYNRITSVPWEPVSHTLGLCMYGKENPEAWGGDICEDDIDAQRCPLFKPLKTKENILEEFVDQLATPGWLDEHMPGAAELVWVLEDAPKIPWWKLFWYKWVLRVRLETPRTLPDATRLLPPLSEDMNDEDLGS